MKELKDCLQNRSLCADNQPPLRKNNMAASASIRLHSQLKRSLNNTISVIRLRSQVQISQELLNGRTLEPRMDTAIVEELLCSSPPI